jgi:3-ketoacyl-CoA synthase
MLSYQCQKAAEDRKLDTGSCAKIVLRNNSLGIEEYRFLLKTKVSSGIGEETYCPRNVIEGREESATLMDALSEMDDIIFDTLDKLFAKTGVSPSEIDIIVASVSLFSPAPSLSARVIKRYKMRKDIKAFNLSGMGCSASVVAVDLVKQLFKTYRNSFAIVVSTESIGPNWYSGKEKSMMLSNILFRTGGCSMLLTNNRALKEKALLELTCAVRTHIGSDHEAYSSCIQVEDDLGNKGFRLTRDLPRAGAKALTMILRVLLPKVLPLSEMLRYKISYYRNKITKRSTPKGIAGPGLNLKSGIDHFCVHPGGRAIIDEVGKSLALNDHDLEPARSTLSVWKHIIQWPVVCFRLHGGQEKAQERR